MPVKVDEQTALHLRIAAGQWAGTLRDDDPDKTDKYYRGLKKKWWSKLPFNVRSTLFQQEVPPKGGRSTTEYWLGNSMVEAGVTPEDAYILLKRSVWNKHRGTTQEVAYLWNCIPESTDPRAADEEKYEAAATSIADIALEANFWLWNQRVPLGELTLLGARQGTGKSVFIAWLMAELTKGRLPGEFQDAPRDAFIAADEESLAKTIAPRLRASGCDPKRTHAVSMRAPGGRDRPLELPEDIPMLKRLVEKSGAKLLVLDTLSGFLVGGQKFDSHNEHHVRKALRPLATMAQETEIAVLGTMHLRKNVSQKDMMTDFLGSVAYTAVARSALGMTFSEDGPEADDRLLFHVKANGTKLQHALRFEIQGHDSLRTADGLKVRTSRMRMLGDAGLTYDEYTDEGLSAIRAGAQASAREKATDALRDALSNGTSLEVAECAEIAKTAGCSERYLRDVRTKLGIEYFWEDGVKMMRLPKDA